MLISYLLRQKTRFQFSHQGQFVWKHSFGEKEDLKKFEWFIEKARTIKEVI